MEIRLPLREEDIKNLRAGDVLTLSGVLYTARDQAHARLVRPLRKAGNCPSLWRGRPFIIQDLHRRGRVWLLALPAPLPATGWIHIHLSY